MKLSYLPLLAFILPSMVLAHGPFYTCEEAYTNYQNDIHTLLGEVAIDRYSYGSQVRLKGKVFYKCPIVPPGMRYALNKCGDDRLSDKDQLKHSNGQEYDHIRYIKECKTVFAVTRIPQLK